VPNQAGTACVKECLPPNFINPNNGQCEEHRYTITIEPNGAVLPSGVEYTIEPIASLPLKAVVKDNLGLVKPDIQVKIEARVENGSGGHLHTDGDRPSGTLTCSPGPILNECTAITTDGNGEAAFDFHATAISGIHTVIATCSQCDNMGTAKVNVKVDHLIQIPDSDQYSLKDASGAVVGAIPNRHEKNHYLTAGALLKLKRLVEVYAEVNPGFQLYLNDAILEWGGI
jgi:hypothetical protein